LLKFVKARDKAEAMAKQNGVKIKRVVTFSESREGGFIPPLFAPLSEPAVGRSEGGFTAPTIEPGSQEVTVRVSVTYEIK